MKTVTCDFCQKERVPVNESIRIDHQNYCKDCFAANFPDQSVLEGKIVENDADPTICAFCGADFGARHLAMLAQYPVCEDCHENIKNKAFPAWVKAFMIGILAITLFSFCWNWRFYDGFVKFREGTLAANRAEIEKAAGLLKTASDDVPEVSEMRAISCYFNGIALLQQDKSKEALSEFNQCTGLLPDNYGLDRLVLQAQIGASFDNGDYAAFLRSTKKLLAEDDSSPLGWASVASAYACLYAKTGADSLKTQALRHLEKAYALGDTIADVRDYGNFIEHRIYSREIMRKEEFDKKFPNGWSKNQ